MDAGVGGTDTDVHPINAAFASRAEGPEDPEKDVILMENRYYPCVLQVKLDKNDGRLKQVAELKGLDEKFFSLSVGANYRIGTRIQVIMIASYKLFFLFFFPW